MRHGARPIALDPRDFSYLRTFKPKFGSIAVIPNELNVDAGFPIPDQNAPNHTFNLPPMPDGCTDYTTATVCSDEDGVQYNPGFTESLTHANANGGGDIRASLLTAVKTGVQALGETVAQAGNHKRAAIFRVGQNADFFDGIRTVLADNKRPLSCGSPWFPEWEADFSKHIAPAFTYDGVPAHYPWHNWEITKATAFDTSGKPIRGGEIFLAVKSWQGTNVYDKGWLYMDRPTINKIFAIFGSGVFTVAKALPGQVQTVGETYIFMDNLTFGQTSPEVAELQKSLKSLGYSIPDGPTTFFGNETKAALAKFQKDHGIADDGSDFGPLTRSVLNALQNPAQSNIGDVNLFVSIFNPMLTAIMNFLGELFGWKHDTDLDTVPVAPVQPVATFPATPVPFPVMPVESATTTPSVGVPATSNQQRLYNAAAASLDKTMKADPSVPNMYACASSLSGVLMKAGFTGLPRLGLANTNDLNNFFAAHPQWFQRQQQPAPGDIVMFPSPPNPQPNQLDHGHTGVMAAINQGVMSNDSDTGLWREAWTLPRMIDYYVTFGRLTAYYWRYIG